MQTCNVKLKNGQTTIGDSFDEQDSKKIESIFKTWLHMNKEIKSLNARGTNIPDIVSEGLFCVYFDAVRTNNKKNSHSFDCVIKKTGEGVQVKSASIENDCTSFGPTSTWDLLYFMDFAPKGIVDGNIYIYKIDFPLDNIVLNNKKHETFSDQQKQGRRPRLSIKELIQERNIQPEKKIYIHLDD